MESTNIKNITISSNTKDDSNIKHLFIDITGYNNLKEIKITTVKNNNDSNYNSSNNTKKNNIVNNNNYNNNNSSTSSSNNNSNINYVLDKKNEMYYVKNRFFSKL